MADNIPQQNSAPEVVQAEKEAQKTSTSKGEKLFNMLTYGGIAGLGTFILTIPIAYWAKYGGGAKGFESASKSLAKTGMSPRAVEDTMMTTATMQGGNLAIIPVKVLENFKPAIVEKLNNALGDKSGDASVDKDPEQTWGSLIKARIAAWAMVFASFRGATTVFGGKKFEEFENKFAEHLVCNPLGKATHTPGLAKTVENETKLFRYGKIAALDVFATAAATTLLFVGSRFFAKKNPQWKAQDVPEHPSTTAAQQEEQSNAAALPRMFADTIPQRSESFTESVTRQKTNAEATPGISA